MNIICIYWEGDFRNRDYTPEDIERLRLSVDRHLHRPYTFYCLTNAVERLKTLKYVRPIELKHNWPGWWAKVELHRPDLPAGRTLYLDLDSHVVSDLFPIISRDGDLVMFNSERSGRERTKDGVTIHKYQAATMLFTPGSTRVVYNRFNQAPQAYMTYYRSDQDVMAEWIPNQPTFPDEWMTKLRKCRKRIPEDTIIVTGRPGDGSFRRMEEYEHVERAAR